MQKYKLAKVFLSFILILSLLVSIGTPVGAIEPSYKYSEDSTQVLLRLSEGLPVGKYTLKYDNEDGVLSEYADICTLEVVSEGEAVVYTGFIKENVAPSEATTIGVYTSSGGRIDELSLEGLENAVEKKQYSFGAISDTHIGAKTSKEDLQKALTFFEQDKDVEFTTICGDLSLGGSLDNLNAYKSIVNTYSTKPVYAISGNHETNAPFAPLEMKGLQPYTEQDLYYSFEKGDDVYVMVGMHSSRAGLEFAEGELQWLYETLEKNRNKRCFLFMHLFPKDGSGDAVDLDLEGDMLSNTQGKVFYSLLSHYNNVIYFHGHSHQAFKVQEQHNMNTYDKIFGCHSVHIPSLAYPKYVSNGSLVADYNASEGYVVDVYENSIVLRGRDFVNEKYLPIAQYSLDTTIKPVQANTYYDSTGTIMNSNSNVLSAGSSWYQGNFNKNEITKIVISDGYSGGYDEKWDATVSQSGEVVVYRKGTVLYVVGNENGVVANTNCSAMFSGFVSLEQIENFEKIKLSNITDISGMFKNCVCLSEINLRGFIGLTPTNVVELFSGCRSLKNIDLSAVDFAKVNKFNNMFYNCVSLESVLLPTNAAKESSNAYCVSMFKGCSALEEINMSGFSGKGLHLGASFEDCKSLKAVSFGNHKILGFNATFAGCSSLKTLDISGFDFSSVDNMGRAFENCTSLRRVVLSEGLDVTKVNTMSKMFYNCPRLYLDCSKWNVKDTTDTTLFNEGSPNVAFPGIRTSWQTKPLIVDTSSYFWMRKESGLNVAQTHKTPDIFSVTAEKGSSVLTLTDGIGFERLSENNVLWAGVIEYDDGSCKPCIVTAVDTKNNTVTVYPAVEKEISEGLFTALLSDSQHLSEMGYKALMQYVYSVNPKYSDKTVALNRYAPESVEEMSTPYKRISGTPAMYNGKRNDYSAWSMSQSVYGTFLIPYANYLTEGEYGFERELAVDGREGFYETYIGTVYYAGVTDVSKIEKDKGHELHIDWYVDGELVSSILKNTNYAERFCFDVPQGAKSVRIRVYYTQMRLNKDDTISIGDSTLWATTGDYGEKLIENNSSVVQMFDSWGAFWADGKQITENGEVYPQGASGKELARLLKSDGSTLVNRSIGGMTSRYGKAWFDKTVAEKHPDYVLLDYGINDYHSSTGSDFPNEAAPNGDVIDMSKDMTQDEFSENMYMIFSEAISAGITPIYVCGFIAQGPSWVTEFVNDTVELCEHPPFKLEAKEGTSIDFEEKVIFTEKLALKNIDGLFICPIGVRTEMNVLDEYGFCGTGTQITVNDGNDSSEYILVVKGDVDKDGVCDVLDATVTQLYANGFYEPTREEIYAANGCVSEEIDVMSYQNVVNKCLSS